jgi:ankyrin repeat protein
VTGPVNFSQAVWDGDEAAVVALIGAGADVDPADGTPPLHLAIENARPEIGRLLIAAGANVNRPMHDGLTPLAHAIDEESQSACTCGVHPDIMPLVFTEILLASGANVDEAAFRMANRSYGNKRLVALLEKYRKQS